MDFKIGYMMEGMLLLLGFKIEESSPNYIVTYQDSKDSPKMVSLISNHNVVIWVEDTELFRGGFTDDYDIYKIMSKALVSYGKHLGSNPTDIDPFYYLISSMVDGGLGI